MAQTSVQDILRKIVPWMLDANCKKQLYRTNYKGTRGRIGIVGGARDYAGAPYFASMAAMRLGADLTYVICSEGAAPVIKTYSPDLIVTPLLDSKDESEFNSEMDCLLTRLHALVVGPGLGRSKLIQSRAKILIEKAKARSLPLVLDADSLMLINDDPSLLRSYPNALLTPNRIELQRMLDQLYAPKTFELRKLTTNEISKLVKECSRDLGVAILAKGMVDICSEPDGYQLFTNEKLGSNRRCGGQGDVLSGLAGVYLHWMRNVENICNPIAWAAYLAAITTRHCNELAFEDHGQAMLVSDMIQKVGPSLKLLLNDKSLTKKAETGNSIFRYTGIMTKEEVDRYARQMILDEFGPESQKRLKNSSAIIIGAGGLGCPIAIYLAAGGIGKIAIVDDDRVEVSNLHRQILHKVDRIGIPKVESIVNSIRDNNPNVQVDAYNVRLNRENAVKIIEDYDVIIDATDNLKTRYMIGDACVVAKKPMVSGAALKMSGQLTVYNYDKESPCFRCLFPEPPPSNAVGSCSDNGVLGVVPGIVGTQQALEAIKIASGLKPAYAGKMLLFDGQSGLYRVATLSKRKSDCESCGPNSKLGRDLINYDEFCASSSCKDQAEESTKILVPDERVSVEQYRNILESNEPHVLVDVRPLSQSNVSRFEHALQIPVADMLGGLGLERIENELNSKKTKQIFVVCRRGIASQRGTRILQDLLSHHGVVVKDIIGGMTSWSRRIDPNYICL